MTGQDKNDRSRVLGWSPEAAARLKSAVKRYGTQEKVAEAAGISRPSLVEILAGRSTPTKATFARLCKALSIREADVLPAPNDTVAQLTDALRSPDVAEAIRHYLVPAGYGTLVEDLINSPDRAEQFRSLISGKAQQNPQRSVNVGDMAFVPLHDVAVSAGHGASAVEAGHSAENLGFPSGWLRRQFGDPKRLRIVHVRGDSMSPTLGDEDLVMIDIDRRAPVDGIFVLRLDDQLMVKRVHFPSARRILVTSDNRDYERWDRMFDLESDANRDSLQLIGRVVWMGRSL